MNAKQFDIDFAPYFKSSEFANGVEFIKWYHMQQLFEIRNTVNLLGMKWPMIIHESYATSGHSHKSYHYQGLATDFHFKCEANFQEQYHILCAVLSLLKLAPFCGLGVYPNWFFPGFHFDSRGEHIRWIKLDDNYCYGEDKIKSFFGGK